MKKPAAKRSIYDQTHDETYLAAALLMRLPLGPFLDAVAQMEIDGPILDPARYLSAMPKLLTARQMAAALARAQNEIRQALQQHADGRAQLALFESPAKTGPQSVRFHMDRLATAALASGLSPDEVLREVERQLLINLMLANGGNQCRAARAAGIHRNTLSRRLEENHVLPADYGMRRRYRSIVKPLGKRSGPASVTVSPFRRDGEVAG